MKQKTHLELLSDVTGRAVENLLGDLIPTEQALSALSIKSNQLQATVDELKQRCEELERGKWVSVEDRLPEDEEKVLVYFGNIDNTLMGRYEQGVWLVYFSDGLKLNYSKRSEIITHWQPLPSPPDQLTPNERK